MWHGTMLDLNCDIHSVFKIQINQSNIIMLIREAPAPFLLYYLAHILIVRVAAALQVTLCIRNVTELFIESRKMTVSNCKSIQNIYTSFHCQFPVLNKLFVHIIKEIYGDGYFYNLDPDSEKPGPRKTWTQKNRDPEKPGP